jgi:hypothetical protein
MKARCYWNHYQVNHNRVIEEKEARIGEGLLMLLLSLVSFYYKAEHNPEDTCDKENK